MAVKVYKPTTNGRRNMSVLTFEEITTSTPEKSLLEPLNKNGGRNNQGKITVRHQGGGAKRKYRVIDFKRNKGEGDLRERARRLAARAGVVTIVVAAAFLVWTGLAFGTMWFWILAAAAAVALIGGWLANARGAEGISFALLATTVAAAVFALFAALFPEVMPASNDPANSLTIANASSSEYTLTVMSWVALVFLPLVLVYQGWTYWVFRKRVTRASVEAAAH